jgi:MATE family multidrug resistance protein
MSARDSWRRFWTGPGGAGEVLALSYPLILSQMSFTVQVFVDRLFLTWYSREAVAGAVMGLIATWSVIGVFLGTGEYLTTFVAQYFGAGRHERIGPVLWQGVYFSMAAGLLAASLSPLAGPVFAHTGHEPLVQEYEATSSRIFLMGAFPIILMATLSTFFAGRGRTKVVLGVNVVATLMNATLDYLWIFGHGGFARSGVAGAAWATVTSQAAGSAIYLVLMLRPRHRVQFQTLAARLEPRLLARFLRFGLPTGLQYSLELLAFAIFLVIVGRIGTDALAASGIAFNLNMIVFMPLLGLGVGVSSLVGRHLGANRPDQAARTTWSAFWMGLAYMSLCGAVYVLAPRLLLAPYAAGADPATFGGVSRIAVVLLRFVALYSIFDTMNVVFASGLRGAGDTAYPLLASVALSWVVMLVPAYVLCVRGGAGIYTAWATASAYVMVLGLLMMSRFRAGRWTSLRVIEPRIAELEEEPAAV